MSAVRSQAQPLSPSSGRLARTRIRLLRWLGSLVLPVAALLLFLMLWAAAVAVFHPPAYLYPTPGAMWSALRENWSSLLASAFVTFQGAVWSFALSALLGGLIALLLSAVPVLYRALFPYTVIIQTIPIIAVAPIIIIWFGIGIWSKIIVVFLGAVIPILISTCAGVRTSEERFLRVARSFGASQGRIFRSIVLPGTVPFIFTGLKYGSGRALLGVIVGELYAATAGIGYFIASAGNAFQTDKVLVGVLLVVGTGLLTMEGLNRIERRFDVWRPRVGSSE